MSQPKIVTLTIDGEGNVTADLEGQQGKGCHAIQVKLGDKIGTSVRAVKKPEYYKPVKNTNTVEH